MSGPTWRIDDEDGDPELTGTPSPLFVTVRTLGEALVRSWSTWVGVSCLGVLLALGALSLVPHPVTASATLLMVPANPNDESAMTTDVSLLQTRAVGERVVRQLGLEESPEAFLATVTAEPLSNQILAVSVDGPDDAEAERRATSLVARFLEFRGEQLRSVSAGLVAGHERRISLLQARVGELTREYGRASAGTADQVRLTDIVTERAALSTQVTDLQRSIEDATLSADAAVSGTHVIDAPATTPFGSRRQTVLVGASGGLVGGVLAVGTILLRALTSERLHRRRDVAAALGVPVRVGVGTVASRRRWSRVRAAVTLGIATVLRGHPRRWVEPLRSRDLEALVRGLATALSPPPGSDGRNTRGTRTTKHHKDHKDRNVHNDRNDHNDHRDSGAGATTGVRSGPMTLGLAAIDRAETGAVVLRTLADRLVEEGSHVLLVDLTASGALTRRRGSASEGEQPAGRGTLTHFRPDGDPALTPGPRPGGHHRVSPPERGDVLAGRWESADVVIALVEVDPGLDLDVLVTWVEQIVPLVSAGRASRELLETLSSLLTETGVAVPFALLEGADRSDRTSGRPDPSSDDPADTSAQDAGTGVRAVQSR